MRIKVRYITESCGVQIGTEKNLQPDVATELAKRGIVEIIGEIGIKIARMVDKVDAKVKEIVIKVEDKIEDAKELIEKIEDVIEIVKTKKAKKKK